MDAVKTMFVASVWLLLVQFLATTETDPPKSSKLYSCLQNCAYCVQFWEYGLYNGRRCAKRCLRQQGREVVDPDCNNPKMFNYSPRIIDLLLEMQNQADEPGANEDRDSSEEEEETTVSEVKNRSERRAPSIIGEDQVRHDDISEHYKVEIKAQHRRKSKHERGTHLLTTTKSPLPYEHHHPNLRLLQSVAQAKKRLGKKQRRRQNNKNRLL